MALFIVLCPYTAPNVLYLKIVRALFAMAGSQISCHPLILDYIKKESRGKAAALQGLGSLLGEAFAMVVLFGYSKREGVSQDQGFRMAAIVVISLTSLSLCTIATP